MATSTTKGSAPSAHMADAARKEKALAELVACKELKDELDRFGESHNAIDAQLERYQWLFAEYERRKPLAWAAARAALDPGTGEAGR